MIVSNVPTNLKYSKSHEWVRQESDGSITIGITDHAQQLLGDMVFVELPTMGKEVQLGKEIGVVESVKAASDVYTPISGKVIAINEKLTSTPEIVNQDPYGEGWICQLQPTDAVAEITNLLDAQTYIQQIESEH